MRQRKILSNQEDTCYEVSAMYPEGRKHTDVYSCENNCPECKTKCEAGIRMMRIMNYEIVGA